MARVLPSYIHSCHICGTQFTVQNETQFSSDRPLIVQTPQSCPACDAPIRTAYPIEIGGVKDLILTHYGLPDYNKKYGTAQRFLETSSLRPEDIDRYIELLQQLDFSQWQQVDARQKAGHKLSDEDIQETKIIAQARADQENGQLMLALHQASENAKATIRHERERYLQIYIKRHNKAQSKSMTSIRRVRYFIVGDRPVKYIHDPSVPTITTEKYDWETGVFVSGDEYLAEVTMSTGDVEEVEEDEFIQHVERLRRRDIPPQSALVPLYEQIRSTEDAARAAGRKLNAEELVLIASLQRQTYQLFENTAAQGLVSQRVTKALGPQSITRPAPSAPETKTQMQPDQPTESVPPNVIRPTARQVSDSYVPENHGPPEVRAAFERLLKISWKHDHTHESSNLMLLREYLRRAAYWARALDCVEQWPFFDVAAQLNLTARVNPTIIQLLQERLRSKSVSTRIVQTCEWFLRWSLISGWSEVQRFNLLSPYDPLILMYERGGSFRSEHGFYYVGIAGMSRGLPKDYIGTEPIIELNSQVLDTWDLKP